MGYQLKIDGRLIEFPSKADAEEFLINRVLASPEPREVAPKRIVRERIVPTNDALSSNMRNTNMVLEFVKAIANAGSAGTDTPTIMKAVDIRSAVAFGNRGKNINRLLTQLGFEPTDVYTNERNEDGYREWKPGPRTIDALHKLKEIATG